MKLIVFGAAGGIGKHVVELGLATGHEVTAVVRRPAAVTIQHKNLNVIRGDVLDPATISQPIAGQDVVISTVGIAHDAPTTVYSEGVANIMRAMQAAHVRRLFCVSASGLEPGPLWQRLIAKPMLWQFFKHSYSDLVRMETVVKASTLDWTIVRPPRLTDGPRLGQYHSSVNTHLARCWNISRADVADYMLKHLDDSATYCGIVEVAY
ncbi:MAG: SDR family oxidoreductase [Chloroflexota bacterium]